MDGAKRLKSQMADTNSISGTIVIQNNCNNSQLSSPDVSEANEIQRFSCSSAAPPSSGNDEKDDKHKSSLLKIPGVIKTEQQTVWFLHSQTHIPQKKTHIFHAPIAICNSIWFDWLQQGTNGTGEYLSPPSSARRRSSVMFNECVFLHTAPNVSEAQSNKTISQVEKGSQAGDGNIWKVKIALPCRRNGCVPFNLVI